MCIQPGFDHAQLSDGNIRASKYADKQHLEQPAMTLACDFAYLQQYTIAGVVFEPPNGTLGLPYWALRHFSDSVESTTFEEEYRQYCLPVLDPHIITCASSFHRPPVLLQLA